MPRFHYMALHESGEMRHGDLESASQASAVSMLQKQGLTPIEVRETREVLSGLLKVMRTRQARKSLRDQDLLAVTQRLAALLKSGLTLDRALSICSDLAAGIEEKKLFQTLLSSVRRGLSLTEAFQESKLELPSYYLGMIRAGENSGALPQALSRLSNVLEQSYRTRAALLSALIYPAILMGMITLTLLLIVSFVLPRFEQLFEDAGTQLPLATQIVMVFGSFLRSYGLVLLLALALCGVGLERALARPEVRVRLDSWLLRRAVYAETLLKADSARFARTLGMLIDGGMPLPAGFRIALKTLRNLSLQQKAKSALEGISAGRDMAAQLGQLGGFPSLLLQFVRVGLETGRLGECLQDAADILDEESRRGIDRGVAALVPLVTIVMGALVAGLIGSVLVGILSINELAG